MGNFLVKILGFMATILFGDTAVFVLIAGCG